MNNFKISTRLIILNRDRAARAMIAVLTILSAMAAAHAQQEPISTDRPDFVESSKTVGQGRFQIETSVAYERNSNAGARATTHATPTLLRYGIAPAWELRLENGGYTRQKTHDPATSTSATERGVAETSIGLKWHTHDGEGAAPAIAWLLHVDLATGARAFRGNGMRPSLRTVFEWELPQDFSLGVMPGVIYDTADSNRRHLAGILAAVVGKAWNERLRTFVEIAGQRIASSRNGGSTVTYDVGAAYLLSNDMQIDSAFSWGANKNTPDFAWTVGLSVRF